MNLVNLLGKHLKDDAVIQFLEASQINEVVYEFDRLHEGTADEYRASAKACGFELVFDQDQLLVTAFCHVSASDGFVPVDAAVAGVSLFNNVADAESAARTQGHRWAKGNADVPALGLKTSWVRHERPDASVHYEFRGGTLALVTLSCARL